MRSILSCASTLYLVPAHSKALLCTQACLPSGACPDPNLSVQASSLSHTSALLIVACVAGTLNALAACRGLPTLLLRQEDVSASDNATTERLHRFFDSAGVAPVHSIDPADYQASVAAHVKPPRPEPTEPKPRIVLTASQVLVCA